MVVLPMYLVMGRILARLPTWIAAAALGFSALYLTIFSLMLAAGYFVL